MSAQHVLLSGLGAVSAAGWGTTALKNAVLEKRLLPVQESRREESRWTTRTRPVPGPETPLSFLRNPRLRRCSPITRFSLAASLEALGAERIGEIEKGHYRLGILFVFMNGCVNYSNRFYGEVLANPGLASPILFPETVFNAPASHLAAMIGSRGPTYTLIGDSAQFLSAVDLGIEWLLDDEVDGALVVGGEELDWLSSEAALLFSRNSIVSEGAGALLLECASGSDCPRIEAISPAFTYAAGQTRVTAFEQVCRVLSELPSDTASARHAQVLNRLPRPVDTATDSDTFRPQQVLGDSLGAALALQCVFAGALLNSDAGYGGIDILHAGGNLQAMGARFTR